MQDSSTVILYPTPVVDGVAKDRDHYMYLQSQLYYMASRLRAALHAFADRKDDDDDNQDWWLEGFWIEIVCHSITVYWPIEQFLPALCACSCG